MKLTIIISTVVIALALVSTTEANAQSDIQNENTYLRAGLSDMTGFVGIEYFVDNTSIAFGWHKFAPSIADASYGCFDISLYWYGIQDYFQDGWYTALGYSTTNAVQTINGEVDDVSGTVNFIGGYRWGGENIDFKIGIGYLYSRVYDGAAIDISIGFSL